MTKPKHQLQKTATCSSKSRKVRIGSPHCVWNSALHFVWSIFSHWCLVFFLAENTSSLWNRFQYVVHAVESFWCAGLRCRANRAVLLLLLNTVPCDFASKLLMSSLGVIGIAAKAKSCLKRKIQDFIEQVWTTAFVIAAAVGRMTAYDRTRPRHPSLDCRLLRSEIPSGMCAKLRTVAASNIRVHMPWSLYYCLFAPHICMMLFFTHIPFVMNHTFNATPQERLQQHLLLFTTNHTDRTFFVWRLNPARPPHPGHSTILLRSEIPTACAQSFAL